MSRTPYIALPALALAAGSAFADVPEVTADIAPVQSLVAQVMGDLGAPALLLNGTADPHSVQLRPSQLRAVSGADVLFWVGPELTPWLERALEGQSEGTRVALLGSAGTHLRSYAEAEAHDDDHEAGHDDHGHDDHDHEDHEHEHEDHGDHDHDHEDHAHDDHGHDDHDHEDHDHDDHGEGEHHDHVHSGTDPHAWLAPENAVTWLGTIADTLAEADPENAETYRANADAAAAAITEATAGWQATLAPVQGEEIVTFHDAYGYFAEAFGIGIAGSVRPGDAATPSAAAISELNALVAEHGVTCAFGEPGHNPAMIESLAADTGLRMGELDPTGVTLEPGPALYTGLIDATVTEVAACLSEG